MRAEGDGDLLVGTYGEWRCVARVDGSHVGRNVGAVGVELCPVLSVALHGGVAQAVLGVADGDVLGMHRVVTAIFRQVLIVEVADTGVAAEGDKLVVALLDLEHIRSTSAQ